MEKNIKKLFSRTALFTAGKILSKLIVFFMLPIYTNCLTPEQYSSSDLISNLANLLIPIVCLGINEGIFRSAAAKQGNSKTFFSSGVAVFGLGTVVFLALSPLLSLIPLIGKYTWLVVLYVLSSNLHAICSQYVCADGYEKLYAAQGILNTLLTVLLNILFLIPLDMGVEGYVLSVILADFITTVVLIIIRRLWTAFKFSYISKSAIKEMMKFSLPLIPTTICWWITSVSDRYIVALVCSEAENGLYTAAYKVPTLLLYVVTIFNDAWKLSAVEASGDISKCEKFFDQIFKYYVAVIFTGGAALILAARLCARILFSDAYQAAWTFIPILVVATVCSAIDSFFGSVYYVTKKTVYSLWTSLAGAGLNIILNFIFIPLDSPIGGAVGASIATFISYFAVFIIRILTVNKLMKFDLRYISLTVNFLLIVTLAVFMTFYSSFKPYSLPAVIIIGGAIIVYNANMLIRAVMTILRDRRVKSKFKTE